VKLYKVDRFDNEIFLNKLHKNSFIYTVSNLCAKDDEALGVFYSVETVKECEVLLIDVKKFKSLFLTKPEILRRILEESYKSILQLQFIVNRDIVYDGMAKVANMLCNDLDSFNSMKKHEIAYSLHLQPETLSRILKKLVRNELIRIENGKVFIIDEKRLRDIYA
jgi:CRP/FNR family transcriptional regulator